VEPVERVVPTELVQSVEPMESAQPDAPEVQAVWGAVAAGLALQMSALPVAAADGLALAALTVREAPADLGPQTVLAALTGRADQQALSEREGPADRVDLADPADQEDLEDPGDPGDPGDLEDLEDPKDRMVHWDSRDRARLAVGAARAVGVGRHLAVAPFLAPPSRSSRPRRASRFLATTGQPQFLRQEELQGQR
jgi:hypothetical protein